MGYYREKNRRMDIDTELYKMKEIEKNLLVSVIMPTYNCKKYISESIESVILQTYKNWELIIVDDFSSDGTWEMLCGILEIDSRIKIKKLDSNLGAAMARNEGIKLSKGRFIAFLDSDDIWLPNKLEVQVKFMLFRNVFISFTQYRHFNDLTKEYGKIIDVVEKVDYNKLLKGNVMGCSTVMIDRLHIRQIEMPNKPHEDYITWLNILEKRVKYAYGIKEDLVRYRKREKSLSGNKIKSMYWTWNLYRKEIKLSFFQSLFCFVLYFFKGLGKHFRSI